MNKTASEFREKVTARFIEMLESKQLSWVKEWSSGSIQAPVSGTTGKNYNGINSLNLYITMLCNGWSDPRWYTFKKLQILKRDDGKEGHPQIRKGEHGTQVEYWFLFDTLAEKGMKSMVTVQEARLLVDSGKREWDDFRWRDRIFTVFNSHQIDGLQLLLPEERKRNENITADQIIDDISISMGVPIHYDDGDKCFYKVSEDAIYLPKPEYFNTSYAANSSALHELGHATGAPNRLNRNLNNMFGSDEYAFEELIAEITSCMVSAELFTAGEDDTEYWEHHLKNHAAYVQSWIECLKKDNTILEKALKQAELASDFLEMHAGMISAEEYYKKHSENTVSLGTDGTLTEESKNELEASIDNPVLTEAKSKEKPAIRKR